MKEKRLELLAPAGDKEKLISAIHFGADAVYGAGKNFGLRAHSKNFTDEDLIENIRFIHNSGKKFYVTVNIYAENKDFKELKKYLQFLEKEKVDGIIASDIGIISFAKEIAPNLPIHLSTQANATNKYAVKFYKDLGIERIVLARETRIDDIKEIKDSVPDIEIEAFCHGAMCMAYSGRCLLSNYLTKRNANHGDCSQVCRWEWELRQKQKPDGDYLILEEDERGTYLMNSKDLNMIKYLDKLIDAGVDSFKIEGRMKTQYYVASVISAYREAIDYFLENKKPLPEIIENELLKINHRDYTTGFYFGHPKDSISLNSSQTKSEYDFIALCLENQNNNLVKLEQRNRFKIGDTLEVLSRNKKIKNKQIKVEKLFDKKMNLIEDAKNVQEIIYLETDINLEKNDILRKKQNE